MITVLAAIEWDPYIIGVLAVVVSVVVLCGSVFGILATNTGVRLSFLLSACGLAGWMFIMGIIWWVYAIGLIGTAPSYTVREVLSGDGLGFSEIADARNLPVESAGVDVTDADLERAGADEWETLAADDPARAEAQAAADTVLLEDEVLADELGTGTVGTADYIAVRAFAAGGDRYPCLPGYCGKPLGLFAEPSYAVVQVQPALPAEVTGPNEIPPPRVADPEAEVISVVMVRDLGNVRWPPFLVTISSGIAFFYTAWLLHRRDKIMWEQEAAAGAA